MNANGLISNNETKTVQQMNSGNSLTSLHKMGNGSASEQRKRRRITYHPGLGKQTSIMALGGLAMLAIVVFMAMTPGVQKPSGDLPIIGIIMFLAGFIITTSTPCVYEFVRMAGRSKLERALIEYRDAEEVEAQARVGLARARLGEGVNSNADYANQYAMSTQRLTESIEQKEQIATRIVELGGQRPERNANLENDPEAFVIECELSRPAWIGRAMAIGWIVGFTSPFLMFAISALLQ